MRVDERIHVLELALKALNARDWDAYGSLWAEGLITFAPGQTEPSVGRAARVGWVQDLIAAFPNGNVEVRRIFGHDEMVCAELRFEGTHTGPLATPDGTVIPGTGKDVVLPYVIVLRFDEDQVVELHEYYDSLDLLVPLGLYPG
jgi:ketosteroid isomerase-like protein